MRVLFRVTVLTSSLIAGFLSTLIIAVALRLESEALILCRNAAQVLSEIHQVNLVNVVDDPLASRVVLFAEVCNLFAEVGKEALGLLGLIVIALRSCTSSTTSRVAPQAVPSVICAYLVASLQARAC